MAAEIDSFHDEILKPCKVARFEEIPSRFSSPQCPSSLRRFIRSSIGRRRLPKPMNPRDIQAIVSVLFLGHLAPLAAQTGNDLWAQYALSPDTHSNIPNNSFAGYRGGEVPIPDVPVVANLASFGGVGDGTTDNTQAFVDAIDAAWRAGGGAVLIPAGTFRVEEMIHLN
jgi:hypothetical protein